MRSCGKSSTFVKKYRYMEWPRKGLNNNDKMMYKKRWMLALLLAGCMSVAHADLVVLERDGTACSLSPANVRSITFDNGRLVVKSVDGTTQTWEVSAVRKCYFGIAPEVPTGVGTASASRWTVRGDNVVVTGTSASVLTVLNAEGRLVLMQYVAAGTSTVSLAKLPAGVYLVRMNGETLKLMKR